MRWIVGSGRALVAAAVFSMFVVGSALAQGATLTKRTIYVGVAGRVYSKPVPTARELCPPPSASVESRASTVVHIGPWVMARHRAALPFNVRRP